MHYSFDESNYRKKIFLFLAPVLLSIQFWEIPTSFGNNICSSSFEPPLVIMCDYLGGFWACVYVRSSSKTPICISSSPLQCLKLQTSVEKALKPDSGGIEWDAGWHVLKPQVLLSLCPFLLRQAAIFLYLQISRVLQSILTQVLLS